MTGGTTTFSAPGPGLWARDGSHAAGVVTPLAREVLRKSAVEGTAESFSRYGLPMLLEVTFVHGVAYRRVVWRDDPHDLALLDAAAEESIRTERWAEDRRRWEQAWRPAQLAANLALQKDDPGRASTTELAAHLDRCIEHAVRSATLHFVLVPAGLPVGRFLRECGGDLADALQQLRGGSPASSEPGRMLADVAVELRGSGLGPDDVKTLDDARCDALDAYLRLYGWRSVSRYDVDGRVLAELPGLVVECVRRAMVSRPDDGAAPPAGDPLLAEARAAYGLRDDNVGLTVHWPLGLLRRAVLAAGRALALHDPIHAAECTPSELRSLLLGSGGPSADQLAERALARRAIPVEQAPWELGTPEPPPSLAAYPSIRRLSLDLLPIVTLLDTRHDGAPLRGTGVGSGRHAGRARVGAAPEDVLDVLAPGDVLVVPFTTPVYSAVLPLLGGLVTEEGGLLSHAALVAREYGLPAVVGARGACRDIPDGALVELDAATGTIRLLSPGTGEPAPASPSRRG